MRRYRVMYHYWKPEGVTEPFSLHRSRLGARFELWRHARYLTHGNRARWTIDREWS